MRAPSCLEHLLSALETPMPTNRNTPKHASGGQDTAEAHERQHGCIPFNGRATAHLWVVPVGPF